MLWKSKKHMYVDLTLTAIGFGYIAYLMAREELITRKRMKEARAEASTPEAQ